MTRVFWSFPGKGRHLVSIPLKLVATWWVDIPEMWKHNAHIAQISMNSTDAAPNKVNKSSVMNSCRSWNFERTQKRRALRRHCKHRLEARFGLRITNFCSLSKPADQCIVRVSHSHSYVKLCWRPNPPDLRSAAVRTSREVLPNKWLSGELISFNLLNLQSFGLCPSPPPWSDLHWNALKPQCSLWLWIWYEGCLTLKSIWLTRIGQRNHNDLHVDLGRWSVACQWQEQTERTTSADVRLAITVTPLTVLLVNSPCPQDRGTHQPQEVDWNFNIQTKVEQNFQKSWQVPVSVRMRSIP